MSEVDLPFKTRKDQPPEPERYGWEILFSVNHTDSKQRRNYEGESSWQRAAIALLRFKPAQDFDKGSWKTPVTNIPSLFP